MVELESYEGFSKGRPEWGNGNEALASCVRIWPHKMNGEGHFMALLKKKGTDLEEADSPPLRNKKGRKGTVQQYVEGRPKPEERKVLEEFLREAGIELCLDRLESRGGKAYLVPELPEKVKGLRFLRNGLYLGEFKKGRFEPSQAYAMFLAPKICVRKISFRAEEEQVESYLKGETLFDIKVGETCKNGWNLVCVDKFSLGWGKMSKGVLKNKYLYSWRKN